MRAELFTSSVNPAKVATVRNAAGGRAYDPGAEHGLAQMAMTCTLADSYYTSAEAQLAQVIKLADQCTPQFIGKLAVYAREVGAMKDLPCVLVAYLAGKYEHEVLDQVFARVIDNGRMVRNFVQMLRSGRFGRRGLGTQPKRLLRNWFAATGADGVFKNSVGSNPSMADVIKLARPVPLNDAEKEMYRYLIGKGEAVGQAFWLKKWSESGDPRLGHRPEGLPFELLAGAAKTSQHWEDIAHSLSWNATLKNLNTFARHGVSKHAWDAIEARLRTKPPKHVFPYSVMTAYKHVESNAGIPMGVKLAVQDALDAAMDNLPALEGEVAVCVDTSGSMGSPVTGSRGSATGVTTCVQVAALVASGLLRKNPNTTTVVFDTSAAIVHLNPRDSVVTNAQKLARNGGGTDVSCALRLLNQKGIKASNVVIISDNESWFENQSRYARIGTYGGSHRGMTGAAVEWESFLRRNRGARLTCLDIQANPTVQVQNAGNVLNLGGFSDQVFGTIAEFSRGGLSVQSWVDKIKEIKL